MRYHKTIVRTLRQHHILEGMGKITRLGPICPEMSLRRHRWDFGCLTSVEIPSMRTHTLQTKWDQPEFRHHLKCLLHQPLIAGPQHRQPEQPRVKDNPILYYIFSKLLIVQINPWIIKKWPPYALSNFPDKCLSLKVRLDMDSRIKGLYTHFKLNFWTTNR